MNKKGLLITSVVFLISIFLLAPQTLIGKPIKKDTTLEEYTVESTGETYTIVTVDKVKCAWFDRMTAGVEQFAEETGHNAYEISPSSADAPVQVSIIEDLIAKGNVDAICVIPTSVPAVEPVLKKAQEAGIVTVGHEGASLENVHYDLEAFSPSAYGAHFMDKLAECMGEEGKYAVSVGHLTAESHNQWVDAEIARQKEAYPEMELVTERVVSEEVKKVAYENTKNLLRTYPNLEGFLASSGHGPPGIGQAVKELGIADGTCVMGTSLPSQSKAYLPSGAVDMISFWDPAFAGYAMQKIAVRILEGKEEIPEGFDLGIKGYRDLDRKGTVLYGNAWVNVTAENVDEYNF